jgi:branched-chain amino acid transport system ATP-binding protein
MLSVENVSSGYGLIEVLHAVSLVVNEGEMVSIIGTNGAGKSSLLRTISALIPCKSGRIVLENVEISKFPPDKVAALGLIHVPEGRHIFAPLTVYDNLILGTYRHQRLSDSNEQDRLFEFVFKLFPILRGRKRQIAGTLSGGEQQMLALARALMAQPKLLVLDEPSLGLAPTIVGDIRNVLQELNAAGLTMLLVEQNALLALNLAHRAYVLDLGRIVLEGQSRVLLSNDEIKRIYLGDLSEEKGEFRA